MQSFVAWLQQLDFSVVIDYAVVALASLVCIIFHEVCHGLTALALGDTTARDAGRLTLNPLRHVDLWGLIMMAAFRFGWAKPVPVNMKRFKHPVRDMALTAAAGPASNIVLAWVALLIRIILIRLYNDTAVTVPEVIIVFFEYIAILSVGLAVFNIIPIPPLDGSKVLFSLLPERGYYVLMRYEKYGFILMMIILYSGVISTPLVLARTWLINVLNSGAIFLVNLF